jgi:hypothetical protein
VNLIRRPIVANHVKPLLGLLSLSLASISSAQTASYHDHNIFHGAGSAYVNTSPEAQNVGAGGTLRAQLIWNVMPGQAKGGDLDIHTKAPNGQGPYSVTQFDPLGAIAPDSSLRNPPFGSPNTSPTGNQQVNWVNRQVVFANGNSVATLDTDNRDGVPNSPSGSLVENIYYGGTAAAPGYIPSGKYQFAVHNFNYTALSDPRTDYALWITTNGKVGVRSEGHFRGTGQEPGKPGLPVWVGQLQSQGQSSQIYEIEIVNPGVEPHHAGIEVVDQKQRYRNDWFAYQRALEARRKYLAELAHQSADDTATTRAANIPSCPPAPMMCDLASLYRNQSIENFVRSTSPRFIQDSFSPPPAPSPERYAVKVTWVDHNTNWLGYAYIEGTREETLYLKDRASAERVAKSEAEKWGIINEQQQYENDHALAYGAIKVVSYAGDQAIQIDNKYQVVTRSLGVVQTVGGLAQIGGGTVVAGGSCAQTIGAGCIVGGTIFVSGVDDVQSGFRQLWTGEEISTFKSEALQLAGVDEENADMASAVFSSVASLGTTSFIASSKGAQFVANNPLWLNQGNYWRLGWGYNPSIKEANLRVSIGAHPSYANELPFFLQPINSYIKGTEGAGHFHFPNWK